MLEKLKQIQGSMLFALLSAAVFFTALMTVMALWSPAALGPFWITVWFGFLAVAISLLITTALYGFKKLFKLGNKELRKTSAIRQGIILSFWLVSLIALNSLRQLGVGDIVLVSILLIFIEVYLRRNQ